MAPPQLPQELIDRIIDHFDGTARLVEDRDSNKRTLASLSMVARAWRKRSQKHLFSVIRMPYSMMMKATETDLDELGPVFSLTRRLNIDLCWGILDQVEPVMVACLRRFRNLESLSLTYWYSKWLRTEQLSTCFRHFGETVIDLRLEGKASSRSLIYLTSMFPQLRVLQISIDPARVGETRGIMSKEELPVLGNFQRYLFLSWLSEQHNDFLISLSSTSPKFNKICIDSCETGDGVGKLLESCAATLESLDIYIDEDLLGGGFSGFWSQSL